jgi:Ni/Fe-hydrogenase subunit HybB-like protein
MTTEASERASDGCGERPWLNLTELPFPLTRPPVALVVLAMLAALATAIFIIRLATGWGLVTNLNDNYGWGVWKGFNTLVGIALGASGFTTAFAVYMLGQEKYRPLARMAILVGILGYLSSVFSLLIDLGHPERIIFPVFYWAPESPLFEVAWCVMLYLTVMLFEFSPAVFERFGLKRAEGFVHAVVMPLVIGGTVLSTLHQSSLGSLFLNVPDQLNKLWYTPLLPLFFFLSAVYVGPAVVIIVATFSQRVFGRKLDHLLPPLATALPFLLGFYLVVKMGELIGAREFGLMFNGSRDSAIFLAEISMGVIIPMVLLMFKAVRENGTLRFIAAAMVALGLMWNRVNVSIVAWARPQDALDYIPHPLEIGFTVGLWAGLAIIFYLAALYLPVFGQQAHSRASE